MNTDLQRLIELQQSTNVINGLENELKQIPTLLERFEERLTIRSTAVTEATEHLSQKRSARLTIENELDESQRLLSRFKGQLMEVKTNKEYQAMQKEIATAEKDVQAFENKILEFMLEADELSEAVAQTESELSSEQTVVTKERKNLEEQRLSLKEELSSHMATNLKIREQMSPVALKLFESISSSRRGIAVAEASNGHCNSCHVRLRPQVFNELRLNQKIIRCDSCQRILYFNLLVQSQS